MGEFNLKAHSDSIVSFLARNVQNETTAEVVQHASRYGFRSLCFHVDRQDIPSWVGGNPGRPGIFRRPTVHTKHWKGRGQRRTGQPLPE